MEHYFSYMIEGGRAAKKSLRLSIEESFNILWTPEHTKAIEKGTGSLMAMGYDNTKESLDERKEALFTHMSVMMIDCDNLTYDKDIMNKFSDYLMNYEYWTYESASSTPERPKFRAIVPLDAEIEWTQFNKKAIGHLFSMFVDEGASWFEEPLLPKLNTIKHHEGKLFPSKILSKIIEDLKRQYEEAESSRQLNELKFSLYKMRHPEQNASSWRNLPSVKKCLSGLSKGERDSSINAACYAMNKNGYVRNISEFLDEVSMTSNIPREMVNKFKQKYR